MGFFMSAVLPIEEDDRFEIYTASSGQKTFAVPFPFQDNDDVGVYYLSAGNWVKIPAVNYVLTGAGEAAGGSVALNTGRVAGEKILVIGEAVLTRLTSIVRAGKFSSAATDEELDRNVIVAQEQARELTRAVRMARGATTIYEVAGDIADGQVLITSGGKLIGASLAFIADETEAAAIVIALAAKADLTYVDSEIAFLDDRIDFLDSDKAPAATAVTLTGSQTLTNKTLTTPVLFLKNSAGAAPTALAEMQWDSTTRRIKIGTGSATREHAANDEEFIGLYDLTAKTVQDIASLSAYRTLLLSGCYKLTTANDVAIVRQSANGGTTIDATTYSAQGSGVDTTASVRSAGGTSLTGMWTAGVTQLNGYDIAFSMKIENFNKARVARYHGNWSGIMNATTNFGSGYVGGSGSTSQTQSDFIRFCTVSGGGFTDGYLRITGIRG